LLQLAAGSWQRAEKALLPAACCMLPAKLSLLLLVLYIGADHAHDTFAANDLAVFTDSTNACSDFHITPVDFVESTILSVSRLRLNCASNWGKFDPTAHTANAHP
jgi:hypothetical protein